MKFYRAKPGGPVIPYDTSWDNTDKAQRKRLEQVVDRVVIVGGPKVGKTTLAEELGAPVLHTDDLIGSCSWEDVPDAIVEWMSRPGPWTIEGVQTARALRRIVRDRKETPKVDRIVVMTRAHAARTPQQEAMAKGIMKIWSEVEPVLSLAVDVVYW